MPDQQKKFLIVVGGPTAVGKTAFSIALAQRLGTEILSADSRQLYQQLNIGTAKPDAAELAAVPHHFIDLLEPDQEYSAGQFERDALQLLEKLFTRYQAVVVAGGSGLYVQALCRGMDQMPQVPENLREQLNKEYAQHGLAPLLEELQQRDPVYWQEVDRQNPSRIIRALEVCRATGQPYSGFRQQAYPERPFQTIKIGLDRPRGELYARIDERMDQMLAQGLLEEAKRLYPYRQLNALQTVGYQEVFGYLEGQWPWEEAVRLLKRNSRRYAKRQLTWFKKDPDWHWFHPHQLEEALGLIHAQMQSE
ncbi:tRNA (adenosine(37)-N6)-dimethylallyltransferase MiaA [Cesiribacter andamanensis]|uniref:tRNA dimethylallyltransferase n=1 Tax=Cesiribacter andamanensis AMV16 TaxID=1279009 RepID=M7NXV0_9BACT|nr:tRNA (adenosine(37)-N6)-dimethylallyltransferase MiaA [Cesiribacter andamanensis]EMR03204.1 tRNA dimethylallyltransferase [Cesiribacter andamanensis AMV16]